MRKRKALIIIAALIAALAIFFTVTLPRAYVVPILMYHAVGSRVIESKALNISSDTFARQMRFLKVQRYNVLPLEELAELIKDKKRLPPRALAITFDDGEKTVYTNAFPILKKYNFPATLFIIVREVDRPQGDRLNWEEIKEMQDSGLISIGSHCIGPDPLVNMKSEELIRNEITGSKQLLEEKLGTPVALFSYPEGFFNDKIRQMVISAGYRGAVAARPDLHSPSDDIFALKRLRISENCRNMFVFAVESSGYYTFMKEFKQRYKDDKK